MGAGGKGVYPNLVLDEMWGGGRGCLGGGAEVAIPWFAGVEIGFRMSRAAMRETGHGKEWVCGSTVVFECQVSSSCAFVGRAQVSLPASLLPLQLHNAIRSRKSARCYPKNAPATRIR